MTTRCDICGSVYDDAACWTICPHGPLRAAPDAYCRRHDLVNCHVCQVAKTNAGAVPVIEDHT